MALASLRLVDFSDRELLLILNDVADGDGWSLAKDMVDHIDLSGEHPHRHIACRLGWLRRFGAVEREHLWDEHSNPLYTAAGTPRYSQRWRLTEIGRALAFGKLGKAQENAISNLEDAQMIAAIRQLSSRYRRASPVAANLTRREWTYGLARRNGAS